MRKKPEEETDPKKQPGGKALKRLRQFEEERGLDPTEIEQEAVKTAEQNHEETQEAEKQKPKDATNIEKKQPKGPPEKQQSENQND